MSGKAFTLSFISLLAVGLAGFWLVSGSPGQSAFRLAAGLSLMLAAVAGFLIVFRHDVKMTEAEKMAEWAKAKAQGRGRFVLRQLLNTLLAFLLVPLLGLCRAYFNNRPVGAALEGLGTLGITSGVLALLVCLWAVAWWHSQEKKYAGSASRAAQHNNGMHPTPPKCASHED
jgi:hypothetical protein